LARESTVSKFSTSLRASGNRFGSYAGDPGQRARDAGLHAFGRGLSGDRIVISDEALSGPDHGFTVVMLTSTRIEGWGAHDPSPSNRRSVGDGLRAISRFEASELPSGVHSAAIAAVYSRVAQC
jgi:hypothetical protein